MQWQGAGISPPQPLISGIPQHSSTAQEGQKHCRAFLGYPPTWQVVPLPSLPCFIKWRCQPGSGQILQTCAWRREWCNMLLPWITSYLECGCCKFGLTLLWTLIGHSGLLHLPCSRDGGLAPAEKLGSDTSSGCCPHHSARDNGGDRSWCTVGKENPQLRQIKTLLITGFCLWSAHVSCVSLAKSFKPSFVQIVISGVFLVFRWEHFLDCNLLAGAMST